MSVPEGKRYFLSGLLLAGIPWFHFKYAIPMLILALFVMAGIWRRSSSKKEKIRDLAQFLIMPAISAALLVLYSKILYGSFNPTVISPEKNFFSVPLGLKIETLLSFFLDQRDGLLVYAPVFLMLFLVFNKEIRNKIRNFSLLAAIFLSYILSHAYTTVRGGYSPAARPTLFVLWIMMVFLAAFHHHYRSGIAAAGFRWLAGLTVFATAWFFYYPLFLYQPVTREVSQRASSWLWFLSSEAIDLAVFFPSFLKKDNASYLTNWIWLGLLVLGALLYYARTTRRALRKTAEVILPFLGAALLFLVCYFPHVRLQTRYASSGLSFFCNSRNFAFCQDISGFRIMAGKDYDLIMTGQNYDLFFDLKGSAAEKLNLYFFNTENAIIRVRNGKRTLLKINSSPQGRLSLALRDLKDFSLAGRKLVHIGLETESVAGNASFGLRLE